MPDDAQSEEGVAPVADIDEAAFHGAVIAAVIPDQSPRVLKEAIHHATLERAPLVIVNVDVTRFVTYEDPDGYVHSAPIDINVSPGAEDLETIEKLAAEHLADSDLTWTAHQLVGDPALAIKHFADRLNARLLVVGTRKHGLGESIREFFTGSVAARLAHRQHRSILVVPLGEPLEDDEDWLD